mmetsp:Transcript_31649/g.38757  ORF Transcript_31649/g.38757 Transcript_31649/m.38757 type:complete len:305 (+) Transcript_31649:105-1019(+)|eukprot:CAMPEP_0172512820 /NCGR_PEP_ID=MMETSP1066-20121228/247387_1 /TAXON_ID=671091 /ORGANISM="Coscinodiscus wailesii, Strain CCMP2513" /LENGTH=304 /DNA_ID=CAMNT_0013292783 /DNA_START=105 /DNA_END=1019 /DNA_ORIENTATION=+
MTSSTAPLNTKTIAIAIIITVAIIEIYLDSSTIANSATSRFKSLRQANPDFHLALRESLGFFTDIRSADWLKLKTRLKDNRQNFQPGKSIEFHDRPHQWYTENYDAEFTCLHEMRVGGSGDGGKWVCDPHRIQNDSCLVYSIGSDGNFKFEMGILEKFPNCEVHIFDPNGEFAENIPNDAQGKLIPHTWGLINDDVGGPGGPINRFKTLQEIVRILGHQGRTIDVFKIDCEMCEWLTYKDWFLTDVILRQILVEVHHVTKDTDDFFERVQKEGYVIFHKEPNTLGCGGSCVEFSYLKLGASFFL